MAARRTRMLTICPKCSYVRKAADTAPAWQCPSCEVVYSKVGQAAATPADTGIRSQRGFVPPPEKLGLPWKWMLAAAGAALVAWQSGLTVQVGMKGAQDGAGAGAASGQGNGHGQGQAQVVMYSADWCGACQVARAYFKENGIPHTDLDIDKSADARAGYEKHGRGGIPLIFVGKDHMRGFNSQWVEARLDPARRP